MRNIIITVIYSLLTITTANAEHHELGAHVHGQGSLAIAFDGLNGKIDFDSPAESIVGFEHPAKTPQDKKALADSMTKMSDVQKLIQFDNSLGCTFTKEVVGMEKEERVTSKDSDKSHHNDLHGEHADFNAKFSVTCKKSIEGSDVKLDFTSFPRLKKLAVTILVGNLQKSINLGTEPKTISLK